MDDPARDLFEPSVRIISIVIMLDVQKIFLCKTNLPVKQNPNEHDLAKSWIRNLDSLMLFLIDIALPGRSSG